ncbi:universal stress protein [Halomarina ordinaria]|uniref:Universal stress protein n=1 Tax=Halomarina ordinaria TaxID=3033939 RepID=A0ABD5UCB8_9EURY
MDPVERIVAVVDEVGADNIMMSGRKRRPIPKARLGSTTRRVLRDADRPVTACLGE